MVDFDLTQAASAAQFDRQNDRYGKSHILADTSDVEAALTEVISPPEGHALDVATGGGHTALALARMGWQVTAGDVSSKMLENARRLLADEGFALEAQLFPAEAIPFADDSFDLVTVRLAPHHFSSPEKFVAEVARVLKPGGHFLLIDGTVPNHDPETEAWLHQVEKWRDPSHGRFLSCADWEELMHKNKLTIFSSTLQEKKQPDLEWYFETAATTLENRERVLEAIRTIPIAVRAALRLTQEDGKIIWWWPIIHLIAQKITQQSPML